jgi:hypothetical protein
MLGKKVARCRTVYCLILCDKPGNKFCLHASHSKILRQYRLVCAKWRVHQQSLWSSNFDSHGLLHWHGQQPRLFAPLMVGLSVDHCRWTCDHFSVGNTTQVSWTDSALFLRMLVVAFRTFLWPSYQVLAELDANTLLLQHIHFKIWRSDK